MNGGSEMSPDGQYQMNGVPTDERNAACDGESARILNAHPAEVGWAIVIACPRGGEQQATTERRR